MSNKRPKPDEMVSKLRQVEVVMRHRMAGLVAIRLFGVVTKSNSMWPIAAKSISFIL